MLHPRICWPTAALVAATLIHPGCSHDAEIYIMDRDGSNPSNLTNDPAADFDPAWSP